MRPYGERPKRRPEATAIRLTRRSANSNGGGSGTGTIGLKYEPEDRGSLRTHARAAGKAEIREETLRADDPADDAQEDTYCDACGGPCTGLGDPFETS